MFNGYVMIGVIILFLISLFVVPEIKICHKIIPTYWLAPFIGAVIILASRYFSFKDLLTLSQEGTMNPLEILILFFSMSLCSLALDSTGFFEWLASICVKHVKSQKQLFFIMGLFVSLLTIVTSNDIIILTITPFLIHLAKKLGVNPWPYLIEEFVLANSFSGFFLIGNPTNIFLTSFFNVNFWIYAKIMILPTLGSGLVSLLILYLMFRKSLKKELIFDLTIKPLEDKLSVYILGIILALTTIMMAVSHLFNLSMWLIALIGALLDSVYLIIMLFKKKKYLLYTLKHMPWFLAPFVLGMETLVLGCEYQGLTTKIAEFLSSSLNANLGSGLAYSFMTLIVANLTNNIPASLLMAKILPLNTVAIYGSVLALNLGAFVTPVGALAGMMWKKNLEKENVPFKMGEFVGRGIICATISLIVGVIIIYVEALLTI